jgi:predicted GNAT family N-acyltransferase
MGDDRYSYSDRMDDGHLLELHRLYQTEWWSRGRTMDDVKRVLEHSDFVFPIFSEPAHRLVAFARVLSDRVFKALIFDVIVAAEHRGERLGRMLMDRIVRHPELDRVKHFELYCLPDLVPFYEKWGFSTDVGGVAFLRRTGG